MQVTKCKYLPFDAGKTAYFDRLRLQYSLRESKANFGWLFCYQKIYIQIKQT